MVFRAVHRFTRPRNSLVTNIDDEARKNKRNHEIRVWIGLICASLVTILYFTYTTEHRTVDLNGSKLSVTNGLLEFFRRTAAPTDVKNSKLTNKFQGYPGPNRHLWAV